MYRISVAVNGKHTKLSALRVHGALAFQQLKANLCNMYKLRAAVLKVCTNLFFYPEVVFTNTIKCDIIYTKKYCLVHTTGKEG